MERVYNKLVRDNIPKIIEKDGNTPVMRVLTEEEYRRCLFDKLNEEIMEFRADESLEELCDVLEVVDALKMTLGYSDEMIVAIKNKKAAQNGVFKKRLYLEKVIVNEVF